MNEQNLILLVAGDKEFSDKPSSLWSLGNGNSIFGWQIYSFETARPNS